MKFRPEAEIWPMMLTHELKTLAADIDENGQQHEIYLYEGDILDGRNRWVAMTEYCQKNKTPKTKAVNPSSPMSFVISCNEQRRHLSEGQRQLIAARTLPFFEAEARRRQARKPNLSGQIGPNKNEHRARDDAAVAFNTSPRGVAKAKRIIALGAKQLVNAIEENRLSIGKADEIIRKFPDKNQQVRELKHVADSKAVSRAKGLTGEIEWYTPRQYIDLVIKVMGAIDLDPASSEIAQQTVRAKTFFTIENDGLTKKWTGRVFLNPPFAAEQVTAFTQKLIQEVKLGNINEAILLVNTATDTKWCQSVLNWCSAFCHMAGRIHFLRGQDGEVVEMTSPTHSQTFFYFGNNVAKFASIFGNIGSINVPYVNVPAVQWNASR